MLLGYDFPLIGKSCNKNMKWGPTFDTKMRRKYPEILFCVFKPLHFRLTCPSLWWRSVASLKILGINVSQAQFSEPWSHGFRVLAAKSQDPISGFPVSESSV